MPSTDDLEFVAGLAAAVLYAAALVVGMNWGDPLGMKIGLGALAAGLVVAAVL